MYEIARRLKSVRADDREVDEQGAEGDRDREGAYIGRVREQRDCSSDGNYPNMDNCNPAEDGGILARDARRLLLIQGALSASAG